MDPTAPLPSPRDAEPSASSRFDAGRIARYAVVVGLVAIALVALASAARVLLLVFGGILFAVVLRAGGRWLGQALHLSPRWGTVALLVVLIAATAGVAWLVGDRLGAQLTTLQAQLPEAASAARARLGHSAAGRHVLDALQDATFEGLSAARAMRAASMTIGVLSDAVLVVLLAVYLALDPQPYRRGVLALTPAAQRGRIGVALGACGHALRRWMGGQLVSMATVGVLTWLGLWLVGIPSAGLLGLIAGLLEFIPIIGPFIAAVPGILLALALGVQPALYAALVYFVVQQAEGALITPLAQKWVVRLAPALGLAAVLLFGTLFGAAGVLFAVPLTVVLQVLVRTLYLDRGGDRPEQRDSVQ